MYLCNVQYMHGGVYFIIFLIWGHKLILPCIFHAHSQVHNMILSLFYTYFRGVGMKRPFRPTTFRDHLSKSNFLFSFFKNCIQQLPLPTSQARAGGSWQFKQVVVVDIAVVVVLVVVVVDLHLIHLV